MRMPALMLGIMVTAGVLLSLSGEPAEADRGGPPFEIHALSTPDGSRKCVVVREETSVMGGGTVALAIACFPSTPPATSERREELVAR